MMMASSTGGPRGASGAALSRGLRFELADEENRALLGSYAISASIGVAFLLLLQFGPHEVIREAFPAKGPIFVGSLGTAPIPTRYPSDMRGGGRRSSGDALSAVQTASAGAIGNAFATRTTATGATTDDAGLLRGLAVRTAPASGAEQGGKTVLGMGSDGTGSILPRRGGVGDGQGGSGTGGAIGGMTAGGGVARAVVSVSGPEAVRVDPLPRDTRNASELGTFVRGREAELRFCYQENGLKVNPGLGGSITVSITVAGSGAISEAEVTRRTWAGRGAAEVEGCILNAVRGWKLPPTGGAAGTYSFPFNFTK